MSKKTFEVSLTQLEDIVNSLEAGELTLDDSIKKYEEGIKLYRNCKDSLAKAEKKVSVLTESLKEEDYLEE